MFAEIDGNRIHYTSYGEGPPVLLLHGLGGTGSIWHGAMQAMKQHHHVVAPDLRGHGRSDGGDLSIKGWASDVSGMIRHLELPGVRLVGHSLGSLVAQYLATTEPDLIDELVLVGGISYFQPKQVDAYRERADLVADQGMDAVVDDWLAGAVSPQSHAVHAGAVGLLRDVFVRNDPASYAKACRALAETPHIDRNEIGHPTLLLVGAHDRSTPLAMTEELKRDIPVSRLRVLPRVGHWSPVEEPEAVAAAILEFLS